MIHIYIPTYGRPESQPTYDLFKNIADVTLVAGTASSLPPDINGSIIPHEHVGEARRSIISLARQRGHGKIIMMDDDLKFFRRMPRKHKRGQEPGWDRFEHTWRQRDMERLLVTLNGMLDDFAHGGVTQRFMAHTTPKPYTLNSRYTRVACLNLERLPDDVPEYRLSVHEDIDAQLQMARAGFPSFLLTTYAVDDHGQYAAGGCSRYRNEEVEREQFRKLQRHHPEYVSFKPNPQTGVYRTRVAWKKAYKEGRANADLHSKPWKG